MVEVLGQLQDYFESTYPDYEFDSVKCTFSGSEYEVWEMSEGVFETLCSFEENEWSEKFPDSWFRHSTGSVLETPDTFIKINGFQLYGWQDKHYDSDIDDQPRTEWKSLTSYLCNNIGASQPKNICALCVDLAKFNGLTLGELWNKCEPNTYKIIYGIPAMFPPADIGHNEKGHIEDLELEEDSDIWCDFSLEYNVKENYYYFGFETYLGWEEKDGCRNWIVYCLNCLTEYMDKHNLDKTREIDMYSAFTEGINVNSHFKSIENAYAWLKMMVFGFHGQGLFVEKRRDSGGR